MRAAQRRFELDFDRISQIAGRTFSPEAQEEIRDSAEQFISEAFDITNLPAKSEYRLCQRIVNKIDKASDVTFTLDKSRSLRKLLEDADREGLALPNGVVQRALKRLDDSDILKELREAAIRRITPAQVLTNAKILKIEVDEKTIGNGRSLLARIEIESENPQMVDAGFPYGRSGAKSYTPFALFARVLYRIYYEAGGTVRYTHNPENGSYSGEAIDFICAVIEQTCIMLRRELVDAICPTNQGHAIARVIKDFFRGEN
jgi:hypothetical protein